MSEKVKPKCDTCGTELTLCYEWDHGGLRGDVLKCLKCTPIGKAKPKQRHRRVRPGRMAEYICIAAFEGRPRGKFEVNLDKCAWYKLEADE